MVQINDSANGGSTEWPGQVVWTKCEGCDGYGDEYGHGACGGTGYKYPLLSKPCSGTITVACRARKYGPLPESENVLGRQYRCRFCEDRTRELNVSLDTLLPTVIEHVVGELPLVIQRVPVEGWPDSVVISRWNITASIGDPASEFEQLSAASNLETALLGALLPQPPSPASPKVTKRAKKAVEEEPQNEDS
tara:strand:+ start:1023 stop:1598 length:576 start_codon:yes stop_codon:yes gene_type:complete